MDTAFGARLNQSAPFCSNGEWYQRWLTIVHLDNKLYHIPGGSIGRQYVDLLCSETTLLAEGTYSSERLMVFSAVMLQRDRLVRKGIDIRRVLRRRMGMWQDGEFDLLVEEAIRCNKSLRRTTSPKAAETHLVSVFTKLMLQGKVKSALRWLSDQSKGKVFHPKDVVEVKNSQGVMSKTSVLEVLKSKHPDPVTPPVSALIKCDSLPSFSDVEVTGAHIHHASSRVQGSAGPCGSDASHWQDVLLRFGAHSERLRDAVASLARHLTNSITPWENVHALMACRLIALDKCPGVRPVGIGETLRRIIGKTVCALTRYDLDDVCGISQLCGGVRAGIEGAIHAIRDLFDEHVHDGWGVLLVDASNAFNVVNRQAVLWNSRVLWPRCSRFLFNSYQGWVPLVISGSEELLYSREGVTQGDPLSMFIYAVATVPLIRSLGEPCDGTQVWFADDASACALLARLRDWFIRLLEVGPSFGYYPQPTKSYLVVNGDNLDLAHQIFDSLGVKIVKGHRLLGGYIGDPDCAADYVNDRVSEWCVLIEKLTTIAKFQPQAAYCAFTRSIQSKWLYIQRVIPQSSDSYASLEHLIFDKLLPTIFGCEISVVERNLFSLPALLGGLNILNPTETVASNFSTSVTLTNPLTEAIKTNSYFDPILYNINYATELETITNIKNESLEMKFLDILPTLENCQQRATLRAKDEKISSWLTVLPVAKHHFDLSAQEFRDALAIRYKKPLLGIPALCDGCGAPFNLAHALCCRKGGLITQRHNEVRDTIGDLSALAWSQVKREPIVREASSNSPALIADLSVRGVWLPQSEALFDIRIVDTDAQSYVNRSPSDVLASAEKEKKDKYQQACIERRALFTPLCISVDGMLGNETTVYIKKLADMLSLKWSSNYNHILCWLRTHLSFAILRASILCLRGSRTKWRSVSICDGSPLNLIMS
jgi:hypothetical protein